MPVILGDTSITSSSGTLTTSPILAGTSAGDNLIINDGTTAARWSFATGGFNLRIRKSNTSGVFEDRVTISENGKLTVNAGAISGGTAIQIDAGGDLRIFASNGTTFADVWCDATPTGGFTGDMGGNGYLSTHGIMLQSQRTGYDRSWNDNPSINVLNDTTNGSQVDFRLHGSSGISGGDFGVNFVCDGNISSISDERTKTQIANIENALDTVLQLQGKTFKYVNSELEIQEHTSMAGGRRFGFIAQQVKDIIPESVLQFKGKVAVPNEHGYAQEFALDSASLVALLTEAIKDLNVKITALENRLAE